jgi:hypothetical protein
VNAPRGLARLLHGGQQQRNQHGDNRNHHQQFDQSEPARRNPMRPFPGPKVLSGIRFGEMLSQTISTIQR